LICVCPSFYVPGAIVVLPVVAVKRSTRINRSIIIVAIIISKLLPSGNLTREIHNINTA
jgi:hypothetical protein